MTKKTKIILFVCSVVGLLLLEFLFRVQSWAWTGSSRSVFPVFFDDELLGITLPVILILGLIIYLFFRKKEQDGLQAVKKTTWTTFVMLGFASLVFVLFLVFLLVFMS